jgi:dolichyl-phosphate-mannose-protein mannosyltransferase
LFLLKGTLGMRSADFLADRIAILLMAVVALAAALTFRDYGLGWDDYTHSQYGDLLLKLYGSGFSDRRALNFVNLYLYGGGFDMASALAAKILPFGLFETRRLMGAVVGLIGLFATWRLARRLGGPMAGLCALALLASCPLYYGHMFMNAKDSPFATAMIVLLLGVVRAFDEYPRASPRTMVLVSVALGAAFGSRVLALIAAPIIAAGLVLIVVAEIRELGLRDAGSRLGEFVWSLFPALPIAYLIMGLLWPWSILSPFNPLGAAEYFDTFFEKPWKELYEGRLIPVPDMPASYLPHLFWLKLPEIMLALGITGSLGALAAAGRHSVGLNRRACLLVVALAAVLPVAVAIVMHPALYNGLRHFSFVVPPFAVLGGLSAAWLIESAARLRTSYRRPAFGILATAFAVGITLPVIDMVRLHPYEYTAFNWASGGVRMAHDKYMLDYWGLAFKQASEELRARLADSADHPPKGRPWVVAICGPPAPAKVELGPQFETTYDQKKADFAMALGAFYCRHLQAPILATVEREGVVYATVYDFRGRANEKLTTEPPP